MNLPNMTEYNATQNSTTLGNGMQRLLVKIHNTQIQNLNIKTNLRCQSAINSRHNCHGEIGRSKDIQSTKEELKWNFTLLLGHFGGRLGICSIL